MITIRLPKNKFESHLGKTFYMNLYCKKIHTFPKEPPDTLIIAFDQNNHVIGTINVKTPTLKYQLEVERYFQFNLYDYISKSSSYAEVGRFAASVKGVSVFLIIALFDFAVSNKIEWVISLNKKYIVKIMEEILGSPPKIFQPKLNINNIPSKYQSFFIDENDPVRVLLWHVSDFADVIKKLKYTYRGEFQILF